MKRHQPPFSLQELKIEVTYRCGLNCLHCSSDARPSNPLEMSRGDCLRILSDAATMKVKSLALSGGEPLLWPHILEVVEAAVQSGFRVTVYTSGNVDTFREDIAKLYGLGTAKLVFSIFGATAVSHERITRKSGSFRRTQDAIKHAVTVGLRSEVHFVPMSYNWRELADVATLAQELGAARISVLRLVPQGRGALLRDRVLTRIQNLDLRRQIQALREKHGKEFVRTGSPYNFLMVNDEPACWAGVDRLIVAPDMRLYPCDAFKRVGSFDLVRTEQESCLADASLSECWKDSPYLEAVRRYLTTDFETPCCSCKLLAKCASGCLAQKAIAYGALAKRPDPDCLAAHVEGDIP